MGPEWYEPLITPPESYAKKGKVVVGRVVMARMPRPVEGTKPCL
jgi:hypothetical protein